MTRLRHPGHLLIAAVICMGGFGLKAASTAVQPPAPTFLRYHDPSTIVRSNGEYWIFSTGTGILSRHSKDLITWTEGQAVFSQKPAWVDTIVPSHNSHFWAPDIIVSGKRYLLYYSVSSWGKNQSAIALASATTLDPASQDFGWKDEGIVVQSKPNDTFNAIDPGLTFDREGGLWMSFGSFWSGIKLIALDPATGLRKDPASPIYPLANYPEIEAPAIVAHGDYYYLFVNHGLCCKGVNSTYRIMVGRSQKITGPYLDKKGINMLREGGSLFLESEGDFIGPGHASVFSEGAKEYLSYHIYHRQNAGKSTLVVRRLHWDAEDWPTAGEQLCPSIPPRSP